MPSYSTFLYYTGNTQGNYNAARMFRTKYTGMKRDRKTGARRA